MQQRQVSSPPSQCHSEVSRYSVGRICLAQRESMEEINTLSNKAQGLVQGYKGSLWAEFRIRESSTETEWAQTRVQALGAAPRLKS